MCVCACVCTRACRYVAGSFCLCFFPPLHLCDRDHFCLCLRLFFCLSLSSQSPCRSLLCLSVCLFISQSLSLTRVLPPSLSWSVCVCVNVQAHICTRDKCTMSDSSLCAETHVQWATYMNEQCHTYERVMSYVWKSHVVSAHIWTVAHCVSAHMCLCTHMSCRSLSLIVQWATAHIWTSNVTHMNGSCHTYERVMSHIWPRQLSLYVSLLCWDTRSMRGHTHPSWHTHH